MIVVLASAVGNPFSEISEPVEWTHTPSPTYRRHSTPWGGWTTWTIGRLNFSANSKSRVSCPGTAMIAPVP